jgi:phosphate uptake regulator
MKDYSLDSIDAKLGEMLTNSSHMFDLSMSCLLGDANLDSIKENIYSTDKLINELHREIRRELILHSAVNSRNLDVPLLLAYMTMSKDIERIGDYCKNLFEIAESGNSFTKGDDLDYLISLRDNISGFIVSLQTCLSIDEESKVQELISSGAELGKEIDEKITSLLQNKSEVQYPVATTLFYRYLKRINLHIVNAATAIIMPTDKIDYIDE